jgi:FtsK/SpoIIIE family
MRDHVRRVGLPSIIDQTPATLHPPAHMTTPARLLLVVGRPLWAWRVELAAALALLALVAALASILGRIPAVLLVGSALAGLWCVPQVRWSVQLVERRAHVGRQWTMAVRHANLANFNDRIPKVIGHTLTLSGDRLLVRVPPGRAVSEVEQEAETIAAFLRVREVRVDRVRDDAGLAQVQIVCRDPLETTQPWRWPNADATQLSAWLPIPVGIDEDGQPVAVSLVERNVLIGGEPGAGKSVGQSMLALTAALDPNVRLHLFDGTQVDLAFLAGCAAHMVGPNLADANQVLAQLLAEMDERYLWLLANRHRKLPHEGGPLLEVVVIDELAFYCTDREIVAKLRDLVSRGRKAGIIVLAATQKPAGDVLPTSLRDLFQVRWAFRCSTPDASDTILGRGWASQGFTAHHIDPAYRGISYLLADGGRPVRLRTFYLGDDDLAAAARRGEQVRRLAADQAI